MAGQVKDHGVGALTALISGGAVALIGEIFKNAVTEGLKSGGVAFWLTMIAAALAMIVAYISSYNYSVIFRDYGRDSADDDERAVFDSLRTRLAAGGRFMPIYNDLLTRGLDRVDRFFGDADPAVKTLWPGAFGFKGAKPFWTAPAYDRCLLLALLYPLAVLFVVWGVSGEVGKAEAALLLPEGADEWRRGLFLLALALMMVGGYTLNGAIKGWNFRKAIVATVAMIGAIAGAFAGAGAGAFAGAVAFAVVFAGAVGLSVTVAGFGAVAIAFSGASGAAGAVAFAVAFAASIAFASAVIYVNDGAHRPLLLGPFLIASSIFYLLLCYGFALWLGAAGGWERAGPLLLFFGVLTLVNAPFDWLSVGLTRALLRRGVEAGGFALEVMLAAMAGLAFTYWWIFKAVPWLTRPVEWLIPMLRWVAGWV